MRHSSVIYICYAIGVVAGSTYIEHDTSLLQARDGADYPSFIIVPRTPADQPPSRGSRRNKGHSQGSSQPPSRAQSSGGGGGRGSGGPTTPIPVDHKKAPLGTESGRQSPESARSQGSQGSQGNQRRRARGQTRSPSSNQGFGRDQTQRVERSQGSGVVQGVAMFPGYGVSHGVPMIPVAGTHQRSAVNRGYYPTYGSRSAYGSHPNYGGYQAYGQGYGVNQEYGRNQGYGGATSTHDLYGLPRHNIIQGNGHSYVAAPHGGGVYRAYPTSAEVPTIPAPAQSSEHGTSRRHAPPTTVHTFANGPGRYHAHGGQRPWKNNYLGPNDSARTTAEDSKQSYGGGEVTQGGRIITQVSGLKAQSTATPAEGGMAVMKYQTPKGVMMSTFAHPASGSVRIASEDGNPVTLRTETVGPSNVYSLARNSPSRFRNWQNHDSMV